MKYKRWSLVLCLLPLLFTACQRASAPSGSTSVGQDVDGSLQSGGLTRTYHVHIPSHASGAALPLLLAFHGRLGTGAGDITLTHLNTTADQDGFIVVYPDGYRRSWNDGRGGTPANEAGVDDVQFTRDLLAALEKTYAIDAHRVYATGLSNGGFFTQRLACEMSTTFAATVAVAATLSTTQAATCAPARPIPYMLIQGTDDPLVPFNGGVLTQDRGTVLSEAATITRWTQFDGCTGSPTTTNLPDSAHDGTTVSLTRYATCQGGANVAAYVVQEGGHTWPSGEQYLPVSVVGRTTHQIGNDAIWNFLQSYHL